MVELGPGCGPCETGGFDKTETSILIDKHGHVILSLEEREKIAELIARRLSVSIAHEIENVTQNLVGTLDTTIEIAFDKALEKIWAHIEERLP